MISPSRVSRPISRIIVDPLRDRTRESRGDEQADSGGEFRGLRRVHFGERESRDADVILR